MTTPRDVLAAAANAVEIHRPTGTAGLLAGLHRTPGAAGVVTLETVALAPVPDRRARLLLTTVDD